VHKTSQQRCWALEKRTPKITLRRGAAKTRDE